MADLIVHRDGALTYYTAPQLSVFPGIKHAFFARPGGVSQGAFDSLNFRFNCEDPVENVLQNYAIAAARVGAEPTAIARTRQGHTDTILVVEQAFGPEYAVSEQPVDALITNVPGVCLTGFYADCQLVMLYDHRRKVAAIAHSGWRGLASEIVRKTIEAMGREFGCRPADMTAAVGPSICRRCFETDSDVPEILTEVYGELITEYIYKEGAKWHVDLKNITYSSLIRYGVSPLNIDISNQCTCCSTEKHFWSHRRQGENRGVHAGMIRIR